MSFLGNQWATQQPRWHAVAWGLNRPWTADREIGPTYNAYINGAGYWAGFGAREVGQDRAGGHFGPAPLNAERPEGRMDVTVALDRAAGKGWGIFVSFAPAVGKAKAGPKPAFPC